MDHKLKIMMVVGEASGDMHCARLAWKLKELYPSVCMFGMGGKLMARTGVELNYDISDLAVMGITEVLGRLPIILGRLRALKALMQQRKPDALVLVDFPDFNMRLLRFAHRQKIPTIYYIPPKAWAWRRKRANFIAKYTSAVASIFPFEADVYRQAGANVHYVGHPLLDIVKPSMSKNEAYDKFGLDPNKPIIGLMPGSRGKEIKNLLPVMIESAKTIKSRFPDSQFILPLAQTISRNMIPDIPELSIIIVDGSDVYDMMNVTDLIIMASGTATLEATFMLAPMIVIYKVSGVSWAVMSRMVSPEVKSTTLPNIIAGNMIVPELLQDKANSAKIAEIAIGMLDNAQELENQRSELRKVCEKMGEAGAVERVARLVLEQVSY